VINLNDEDGNPTLGLGLTTLKNNGLRLVPYDFDSFTAFTTTAGAIDKQTIYNVTQRVIAMRYQRCVFVVGSHPSSTPGQPVVTLSQWDHSQADAKLAPTLIDQVRNTTPHYTYLVVAAPLYLTNNDDGSLGSQMK
jgi:hypothetical protein